MAAAGDKNLVSPQGKDLGAYPQGSPLVVTQQDCLRPPYHLKHFLFVYNGMPLGGREIDAEGCSVARFAVYVHHAAVTLNYAIDHGQAQSCSPVHFHGLEIIGHPGVDGDLLFRPVKQGG